MIFRRFCISLLVLFLFEILLLFCVIFIDGIVVIIKSLGALFFNRKHAMCVLLYIIYVELVDSISGKVVIWLHFLLLLLFFFTESFK